jgi:hypothetical protein
MANTNNRAEKMRDLAYNYLNENYDDTFVAKGYSSENWAYDYATITFGSKKYAEALIEVRAYKNEDDTYSFKDNYFRYDMNADAVKYLEDRLGLQGARIKMRFPGSVWSDDLAGAKNFIEWKNQGTCTIDVYVLTQEELVEENMVAFVNAIAANKISGSISFCWVKTMDAVADIGLDDFLNNQAAYIQSKREYYINSDYKVEEVN